MKKLLFVFVTLLVLIAAGLAVYVASIDWNQHKDKIAQQFSELTGKNIVFEGPVSFRILPSPYLSATNVKIYNPGAVKDVPLVEIKKLVANLSLVPLLKGDFDVKRMVMRQPQINFEVMDDGTLNWQYPMSPEQRSRLETTSIKLNSVSLDNATLNFEDPYHDISLKLDDLNGEIMADSVMGPFRIEGNYIKNNNPEGFAISIGKLSDSFPTTCNVVFTHPGSKSYVRFDGNFMLGNKVLNGNLIVESEKLMDFAKANFKAAENFQPAYDYPLALTFDLSANEQQVNLSNMVIKYGETQGAGNVQIPLNDGLAQTSDGVKPRMEMAFNFTDFNLDPVVYTVEQFVSKYHKGEDAYEPDLGMDMLVDVKSLKTQYNGQPVKNFEASFDVIDNIVSVNTLTATLPGDTDLKLKGELTTLDGEPFYNMDVSFNSSDFLQTLEWLKIKPDVSVASTYRKAVGSAKLSGTFNKIQLSPFSLTMDKSSLSGEAGVKLNGPRMDALLVLNADMINFDNYISQLPKEEAEKNWAQRMQYRFSKLGFLNDFDMQITAKLDLGIYESLPFEKVDFKANLLNGKLEIERLSINSVANAQMAFGGAISGFGNVPAYENLKYEVKTDDVSGLINKFEFKAPNLDYKQLKHFESKGIATGDLEKFAVKNVGRLESLEFVYGGQVIKQPDGFQYNGNLELKHPDFVKMLNDFNVKYNPQVYSLGLFNLKTKFIGNGSAFRANPVEFNVGFNSFAGDVTYTESEGRPSILTNMTVNKFELDRFMNSAASVEADQPQISLPQDDAKPEFLAKPYWSRNRFDYAFYNGFDLSGNFKVQDLSYRDNNFKDASFDVALTKGNAALTNFKAAYKDGEIQAEAALNMQDKSKFNSKIKLTNLDAGRFNWGGNRYGISGGRFSSDMVLNSDASSEEAFVKNLNGNIDFVLDNTVVRGWNLKEIYQDITRREVPDGLLAAVKENLQSGNSAFSKIAGKLNLNNGTYNFAETTMTGSGAKIGVFGDGNLDSWDMNVSFNVKYDEPKYLPGYSFALKGAMNAPLLDVDVSALFDLYKSKQDKIEAQEKAVIEAEENRLRKLVEEQQKTADALLDTARNGLAVDLEGKLKNASSSEAVQEYKKQQRLLTAEITKIAKTVNLGMSKDLSDALINQMNEANKNSTAALEQIKKEVARIYLNDAKSKMEQMYNQVVDAYNRSKVMTFDFHTAQEKFKARLADIETDFNWDEDANIMGWIQFIDEKSKVLNEQNKTVLDRFVQTSQSGEADVVEAYNRELKELETQVSQDVGLMNDNLNKFKDYAEEKISAAEKAYADRQREEEIRRKVEENTGHISIKKTGKSVTVKRDIEEIEKTEELTSNEKVKVLDFSKKTVSEEKPAPRKENPVKRGRVIRN